MRGSGAKIFSSGTGFKIGPSMVEVIDVLHKLLDDVRPVDHVNVDAVEHAQVGRIVDDL